MANKEQTAVEWIEAKVDGMIKNGGDSDLLAVIEHIQQAKAMEKEQMINFTDNYVDNCVIPNENMAIPTIKDVPQYYKETYG
jgi:hypothetical protein